MIVRDPGHVYELAHLDVPIDGVGHSTLTFVKREGAGYPGNVGHHEGTNLQEVLRALIDRVKYLNAQENDWRNEEVLRYLRKAIYMLEDRAAERHGRVLDDVPISWIENIPTCSGCGHIGCDGSNHRAGDRRG